MTLIIDKQSSSVDICSLNTERYIRNETRHTGSDGKHKMVKRSQKFMFALPVNYMTLKLSNSNKLK